MSELKAIPLSKAKTAYGLLRDVQRVILAEPARADMRVFTVDVTNKEPGLYARPACGTVGCFAGWVNVLSGGREAALRRSDTEAHRLLGYDLNYSLPNGDSVFNAGEGDRCEITQPGTKAHARAVYNRIDGFIKRNLKALKARKLVRVDGQLVPAPSQD